MPHQNLKLAEQILAAMLANRENIKVLVDLISPKKDERLEAMFVMRALIAGVLGGAPVADLPAVVPPGLMENLTEPEIAELMKACMRAVKAELVGRGRTKTMAALLVFDDPALAQYISTCERPAMIKAMRECADRLERRDTIERA